MRSTAGSQLRRMDHALLEVKKAIHSMDPQLEFAIIFYDDQVVPMPGKQAVKPTDANKRQMFAWADKQGDLVIPPASPIVSVTGAPNMIEGIRFAVQTVKANSIFLLTAGDLASDPVRLKALGLALPSGETIQVINFGGVTAESFLRQVAQLSGGQYQFIPDITP